MQIKINIEKKHLYFLTALIVVLAGTMLVIGYDTSTPSTTGHVASEIDTGDGGAYGTFGAGDYSFPSDLSVGSDLTVSGLVSCDTIDTDASGNLVCGTDADDQTCAEVPGCVENAITSQTDDQTCAEVSGCVENAITSQTDDQT